MKQHLGRAVYKFLGTHRGKAAYSRVAAEYYDESLHPTCADFQDASLVFLKNLFSEVRPSGKIADVGCGRSLLAKFVDPRALVLIDESGDMLQKNNRVSEWREVDVASEKFGLSEFDWIFSILGDPYNVQSAWLNIAVALKRGGNCIFIVPSYEWALRFRESVSSERPDLARFDLADGTTEYLPSYIWPQDAQRGIIAGAGLRLISIDHVVVRDLPTVRSAKIANFLMSESPVLDIYRARRD